MHTSKDAVKNTHSFSRSASSRTLDLSHVTPAFWQFEQVGYSLSHYIPLIRLGVLVCFVVVSALFVFSFCSGYTPFSLVCGDCCPSTLDWSVWRTTGYVQAHTCLVSIKELLEGTPCHRCSVIGECEGRMSGRKSKRQVKGMPRHLYVTLLLLYTHCFSIHRDNVIDFHSLC
jgi:hypothetical protein